MKVLRTIAEVVLSCAAMGGLLVISMVVVVAVLWAMVLVGYVTLNFLNSLIS